MILTPQQIDRIVKNFVDVHKGRMNADKSRYHHLPEYWNGYNYSVEQYNAIEPHVRHDVFPAKLFEQRAPNQSELQAKYIKANYKGTTTPVFEDFVNTVGRAFAEQNWSLKINQELDTRYVDESFRTYAGEQIPIFGSLELWAKSMLPTLKLKDANGVIAIRPMSLDYMRSEENEVVTDADGNPILSNELIKPIPTYHSVHRIVGQELGEWYLIITDERSEVLVGNKRVREGIVLELYDGQSIYRIEQTGKKESWKFADPVEFYRHDLGYVPVIKLMGIPVLSDGTLVYNSPFVTAVGLLDLVLLDQSYLQISKATSAFPFMVAIGDICDFEQNGNKCNDGQIWNGDKNTVCPACSGAGIRSRFSPTGQLLIKPKTSLGDGDSGLSGKYLEFVSPSMETLEFLRREINFQTDKARSILHLNTSDQAANSGEAKTATESISRNRATHAFIKPISDQMFAIVEFSYNTIGRMRYGQYYGGIELQKPTTFDIATPSDYLAIITEGVNAGVPPHVTYQNLYNYAYSINSSNSKVVKMLDLIFAADKILTLSSADIIARIANGTIEKYQDILHTSAPQLIAMLDGTFEPSELYPTFFDQPIADQVAQLEQAAKDELIEVGDPITIQMQRLTNPAIGA
jgi:hypothetical protein